MIQFEILDTEVSYLDRSILAAGNPMRLELKRFLEGEPGAEEGQTPVERTKKEEDLARRLAQNEPGTGHANFLTGITVAFTLVYPQYFTAQLQRYHFIQIVSSSSKMHKLTSIKDISTCFNEHTFPGTIYHTKLLIEMYNDDKIWGEDGRYVRTEDDKKYFDLIGYIYPKTKSECYQMIMSNLPMGYMQFMDIRTNYEQLRTIWRQRRNHKLKEWQIFCDWIEDLPLAKELIIKK